MQYNKGTVLNDDSTQAQVAIDYVHHENHEGSVYSFNIYATGLNNTDTLIAAFTLPDSAKEKHAVVYCDAALLSTCEILEGPTITAGTGTKTAILQHDRNSSNVSEVLDLSVVPAAGYFTKDPTITADGTVLEAKLIGGTRTSGQIGTRSEQELILKNNTKYAIRVTSLTNGSSSNIMMIWYEHTPN